MTSEELDRLECRRDVIKTSVTSLGNWLIGFIVAVVIGLGIELYTPIVSLLNKFEVGVLTELIGTTLVTIGVAGELAVEWKTHRSEKELLRIDAAIESEDKKTIAALNAETERLRKENNELAAFLADRDIGDWNAFAAPLKPLAGSQVVILMSDEREAMRLGDHLRQALLTSGWKVLDFRKSSLIAAYGVYAMWLGSESEFIAEQLADRLNENGVAALTQECERVITQGKEISAPVVQIEIGLHPPTVSMDRHLKALRRADVDKFKK